MRIILPPSETKAAGGAAGSKFDPAALSFPQLSKTRATVQRALRAAAVAAPAASTPTRQRWIDDNRRISTAPVMPAIERYTGVLFDAIGVDSLSPVAQSWLGSHVVMGSALFGFVQAQDPIPSYKCSSSDLKGPLRGVWQQAGHLFNGEFVIDLRSKAYVEVAPIPGAVPVEVVGEDGAALNHWNKHGKGLLVRALASGAVSVASTGELAAWARDAGIPLSVTDAGLRLVASPR